MGAARVSFHIDGIERVGTDVLRETSFHLIRVRETSDIEIILQRDRVRGSAGWQTTFRRRRRGRHRPIVCFGSR